MGVLNVTSDSFYDGGKYLSESEIIAQTEKMLTEGASIIDIGAISTRPGAVEIPAEDELDKIIKSVRLIKRHFHVCILSVDTYRSTVAERAIDEGVNIINDISGGLFDEKMFETITRLNVPYIMMHIQGTPQNMQLNPKYKNVTKEIKDFFTTQCKKLLQSGFKNTLIIDPGFGFGKTLEHNFELLHNLNAFKDIGYPLLVGISRKSMINKILKTKPATALNGTTVLQTLALINGANILRTHDVKEAIEAIRLVDFYKQVNL